ncbi:MAG: thioredoxin [Lachnospiraceae bacterium]
MAITEVTFQNYQAEVSQSESPVLLDFYADWCGPCKMLHSELEAFAEEANDIKVCQVNVDNAQELAQLFGILSIPTLVLIKSGQEAARRVGGCEKADIDAFVRGNL